MNKKILIPALALTLLGAAAFGSSQVAAQVGSGQYPPLVQKIAEKFGLNVSDVQTVFDQAREEHQAQMEQNMNQRLSDAVANGELTEAQKLLILNKHEEMQAQFQANKSDFKNLTPEERRAKMEAKHDELEKWAADNGIDLKYFMFKFGGPGHRGNGMMMWKFGTANGTNN